MDFILDPAVANLLVVLFLAPALLAIIFVLRSNERIYVKALWVFLIISLPFLGPVIYLLFRIFNKPKLRLQH